MLQAEIAQLEDRVQRLIAAYLQMRLEYKRAMQERDRLTAINADLKSRIESVVQRLRQIESQSETSVDTRATEGSAP